MADEGTPPVPNPFDDSFTDDDLRDAMAARMGLNKPPADDDEFTGDDDEFGDDIEPDNDIEAEPPADDEIPAEPAVEQANDPLPLTGTEGVGGGGGPGAKPPLDTPDGYIRIGDQLYSREDEAALAQLIEWGINEINRAPVPPTPGTPPATQPLADIPPAAQFNPDDFVDPELARVVDTRFTESLNPLQASVDQLLEIEQARQQREAAERQAVIAQAANTAMAHITESFALTPEESARLEQITAQSGLVAVAQRQGGTEEEVFARALENAYWMTPEFRERAIQQTATEIATQTVQQQVEAQQTRQVAAKRSRAGALAGGSSALPRTPPPPTTKSGRRAEMAKRIAEAQSAD